MTPILPPGFEPIDTAQHVTDGTVADLLLDNGRTVRAAWREHGNITAWWPLVGHRRRAIGLYDPKAWRKVDGVAAMKHVAPRAYGQSAEGPT